MRLGRIAAHDDLGLGVADIVEAVGHRAVAPRIGHTGDGRRMADARLVVGVVGAPERAELAEQIGALIGHLGRSEPVDGIAARFLTDCHQLVADFVDGRLPRDARPLAVDELHRIAKPPLAVDQFAHRGALRAMRSAIDRRIPARLLADPDPVQHFRSHGASDRTMRTDALANGRTRGEWPGRRSFRLADSADRQRAQRSQRAAGKTGAPQESTAIETAAVSRQGLRN